MTHYAEIGCYPCDWLSESGECYAVGSCPHGRWSDIGDEAWAWNDWEVTE